MKQFDLMNAADLRDMGIEQAINHANVVSSKWSDRAISLFKQFLASRNDEFRAEQFRAYAESQGLEEPPSKRAFGGIMTRARGMGWIKSIGLGPTCNPKAHKANAAIWIKA